MSAAVRKEWLLQQKAMQKAKLAFAGTEAAASLPAFSFCLVGAAPARCCSANSPRLRSLRSVPSCASALARALPAPRPPLA